MSEVTELALELDGVVETIVQATIYVAGHDQADSARAGHLRTQYSALRTRLSQAEQTTERIAERLRALGERVANTPPPEGPPIGRDSGPI